MADADVGISSQVRRQFVDALEYLRNANSQSNTKGDLIKVWFRQQTSLEAAVSFITEKKQIGNRLKEQRGKKAPFTIFFFVQKDLIEPTRSRINEYAYPELRAVFFFCYGRNRYNLHLVLTRGKSELVVTHLVKEFGSGRNIVEELPAIGEQALDLALVGNPCELVGVMGAMQQAIASIEAGKHVLFMGPPGTAKTELAECLCKSVNRSYRLTTATAEWTTFETIGGYLTSLTTSGTTELDFHLGIVTESILADCWLIIDEFNRADMDKAFGELFTILLGKTIDLPFQKRTDEGPKIVQVGPEASDGNRYPVKLSPSWRLLATMNSFDKASLARLSLALMRRFSIVHVEPPSAGDYSLLLEHAAAKSKLGSAKADAAIDSALEYLDALFASNASGGLRAAEIEIGPAIPLDAIKYVAQRLKQDETVEPAKLVLEAVTNYLFPQFEGRDDLHPTVIEILVKTLGMEDSDRKLASNRLAIFTGYKPPR